MELFTDSKIFIFNSLDSTNKYASQLPFETPEGTVIMSHFQTHGRGQGNNFWESEAGKNLTTSIILKPDFLLANDQFYISKIISLSITDLIKTYTENCTIKWPNDIYAGNKKIAGILIENSVSGSSLMQCIIGIGININQEKFNSSAPNPVSLKQITGKDHNPDEILQALLEKIEVYYEILKRKDFDSLDMKYLKYLFRYLKLSEFAANGKHFRGTIIGVDTTGELIIRNEDGTVRKFLHKEVEHVL